MTLETTRPRTRPPRSTAPVATAAERLRAFRSARRHSWLVRSLRVLLPSASIVLLALYAVTTWRLMALNSVGIQSSAIRITTDNLVMEAPAYDGWSKDGSRYQVRARTAKTDFTMQGPVRLDGIEADLEQPSGVKTKLKAIWGMFDQKSEILELHDRIDVDASNGMSARLTQATVYVKDNRIVSSRPVTLDGPTGHVTARTLELLTKARKAALAGSVVVDLKPSRPKTPDGAAPARPTKGGGLSGLTMTPGEPIRVTSDKLDIDDEAHSATFRERVVARQGEGALQAPQMIVAYHGQAQPGAATQTRMRTPADTPSPQPAKLPAGDGSTARVKSITAVGGVTLTRGSDRAKAQSLVYDAASETTVLDGGVDVTSGTDRRATSRMAEIDHKSDRVVLTGTVVVTQGKNVLKGERLQMDRKEGRTRLTGGERRGRITARLQPPQRKAGPEPKKKRLGDEDAGGGFLGQLKVEPGQPMDIEADSLEVLEGRHTAQFIGSVHARQGDFRLSTPSLTAFYTGNTGLGTADSAAPQADLRKVEARNGVTILGKDGQKVTGDWADFDPKSNFATVGGRVTVLQGKNAVEGSKLLIDLTTGRSRFETGGPATASKGAPGASSAVPCPPGQTCVLRGRVRAIFYPKDAKKKGVIPGAKGPAGREGSRVPRVPGSSTSSWQSTTSPAGGSR